MLITLDEIKNYLRVDFDDDDGLLTALIASGQQLCMDVARITDEAVFEAEPNARIAVMYAVAYMYEHREEADHKALTLTLRALLFGCRQEGF
ncbi:MAG: head-tail connector protein [Blautia sp.]|nr:head-tail connector protein [Blautia sp.]